MPTMPFNRYNGVWACLILLNLEGGARRERHEFPELGHARRGNKSVELQYCCQAKTEA